jgi:hypothetical protein
METSGKPRRIKILLIDYAAADAYLRQLIFLLPLEEFEIVHVRLVSGISAFGEGFPIVVYGPYGNEPEHSIAEKLRQIRVRRRDMKKLILFANKEMSAQVDADATVIYPDVETLAAIIKAAAA